MEQLIEGKKEILQCPPGTNPHLPSHSHAELIPLYFQLPNGYFRNQILNLLCVIYLDLRSERQLRVHEIDTEAYRHVSLRLQSFRVVVMI